MREIWCLGRVWLLWHTLSSAHDRPFRQPAPAAIAALTGPCLAQNTTTPKNRQRRAARARRAALAVTRPCQHRSSSHAAAAALDARTAAWYRRTGTAVPVGAPTAVDILASFPPVRGLVFGSTACGGSREVLGDSASSLLPGCVVVSPASVALAWRPLHARRTVLHDLDAALPGRLRRGRCACPPPPISRLELIGGSGPLAAPPAATRLPRAPSFRRPPSSRRGEALWERVEAGSGSLGAASSESTAGSGQVGSNWLGAVGCSAPALRLLSRPRFRPSR